MFDVCWCPMFADVWWCLMFADICWWLTMLADVWWCLMFDDVWWCLIVVDDVWSCLLMFDDVWWCPMIFVDVCWWLMMFADAWWCLMVLADMMLDDAWWCLLMFDDVWWCVMMLGDVSWCFMMLHDASGDSNWTHRHSAQKLLMMGLENDVPAFLGWQALSLLRIWGCIEIPCQSTAQHSFAPIIFLFVGNSWICKEQTCQMAHPKLMPWTGGYRWFWFVLLFQSFVSSSSDSDVMIQVLLPSLHTKDVGSHPADASSGTRSRWYALGTAWPAWSSGPIFGTTASRGVSGDPQAVLWLGYSTKKVQKDPKSKNNTLIGGWVYRPTSGIYSVASRTLWNSWGLICAVCLISLLFRSWQNISKSFVEVRVVKEWDFKHRDQTCSALLVKYYIKKLRRN